MKAVYFERFGGPDVLTFGDRPAPSPKPGEAQVRVRACGINHLDLWVRAGIKGLEPEMPHILGNDVVGEITELGAGVTHLSVGAKTLVNPTLSCGHCAACATGDDNLCRSYDVLGRRRNGGYAEFVSVPAVNCLPFPERLSWEQAAAVPLVFLTAWHMLVTRARVADGETVLAWGIGGGVALAAVQVAAHAGARVIATSSSDAKLAVARRYGAAETLNHEREDVVARVRELTASRGADIIVDSVGAPTWQRSTRLLRRGGRLVTCGATGGPHVEIDLRRLFWHQWSLLGSTLGSPDDYREIVRLAGEGMLWPHVDRVVPFDDAIEAYRHLARGEQTGKVVIDLG